MEYYVYRHIRLDTLTPFYIGKGVKKRASSKKSRNQYWHSIVNKYGYKIEIIKYFNDENDALDFEYKMISLYRLFGYCEANLTDGGDGISGYCHTKDSKSLISSRSKDRWKSKEYRCKISKIQSKISKDRWKSKEYTDMMKKKQKKVHNQPDQRDRQSLSNGGKSFRVWKAVITPGYRKGSTYIKRQVSKGKYIGTWISTNKCAEDLGITGAGIWQTLNKVCENSKQYKGYIFEYTE